MIRTSPPSDPSAARPNGASPRPRRDFARATGMVVDCDRRTGTPVRSAVESHRAAPPAPGTPAPERRSDAVAHPPRPPLSDVVVPEVGEPDTRLQRNAAAPPFCDTATMARLPVRLPNHGVQPGVDAGPAPALPAVKPAYPQLGPGVTAVALAARSSGGDVLAHVAVEIHCGGVRIESVEYPWMLAATGRLDQLQSSTPAVGARSVATGARRSATSSTGVANEIADLAFTEAGDVRGIDPAALPAASVAAQTPLRAQDTTVTRTPAGGSAAAVEWQERLLRCLERHGDLHLYVRDYRLDDASSERIANDLHALCARTGRTPARIVVNGRTWNAIGERHHAG